METLGIRKFWKSSAAGADVSSDCDDVRNAALVTDDEGTDDEDSFFDLVIKPPGRAAVESPRDVFMSKNDVSNSRPNPKFKIFLLGFRKSSKTELKTSLITRDNTLRSKLLKESSDYEASSDVVSLRKSVPKYLKLIKPFYHVKASKKAKLTDSVTPSTYPVTAPVNFSPRRFSEGCRVASFKIVARNLGKSRSASAMIGVPPLRRRDDSLLEQADGIQGAILHCKKSYESSSQEYTQLFRSSSDPSHKILRPLGRNSCEEPKRYSI
ncbi:hypothetical protein ACJIZ3_022314 [Penstemon smallii]|uniref:Membrane-associated kinase regulator 2 n=1 Tax=Penstemon smallii TaxID=265156 RepID=A0ABD3TNT2_9LAMI